MTGHSCKYLIHESTTFTPFFFITTLLEAMIISFVIRLLSLHGTASTNHIAYFKQL